jgi:hypothetical protein
MLVGLKRYAFSRSTTYCLAQQSKAGSAPLNPGVRECDAVMNRPVIPAASTNVEPELFLFSF